MSTSLNCSNEDLALTYRYYRYTHRLLSLSFIYESLRRYDQTLRYLGENSICVDQLSQQLKKCQTKSKDMGTFISNLEVFLKYRSKIRVNAKFSVKSYKEKWLKGFNDTKFNLVHYRARGVNSSNYKNKITNTCNEEISTFKLICSEEDSLLGMSNNPETYPLLLKTNVFNYFKGKVNIKGCLRRFKSAFAKKELDYSNLNKIFPYLYQSMYSEKSPEGQIFALGSLKEFSEKGLGLYQKQKKETVVTKKVEKKKVLPAVKKIEVKKIIKIAAKPKKTPPKEKVKVLPKPEEKTAFFEAYEKLKSKKLKSAKVDLDKFKYDYVIPLSVSEKLDKSMSIFLKQSSLKIMKENDGLGESKSAIPLILIKYMVDYNKHVELYNIINVIGEEFFVTNAIDKKMQGIPVKIRIQNNVKTNYNWEMKVLL